MPELSGLWKAVKGALKLDKEGAVMLPVLLRFAVGSAMQTYFAKVAEIRITCFFPLLRYAWRYADGTSLVSTPILLCWARDRTAFTASMLAVGEVLSKGEYASGSV